MTLFDTASLEQLARHLDCGPADGERYADMIAAALLDLRKTKTVPFTKIKQASRQLRSRANTLEAAAKLLRSSTKIGIANVYSRDGGPTAMDMERAAQTLEWTAGFLRTAAKPPVYRYLHGLAAPVKGKNRLKPQTERLWPTLVEIWRTLRREPAASEGGPFLRFIQFVHRLGGLSEPHQGTLRSALKRSVLSEQRYTAGLGYLERLYNPPRDN